MNKRKVQVSIFYCDASGSKYFLLLKTNKKRGEFWQSVTGGVDEGESFLEAAQREFFEETQITKENIKNIYDLKFKFEFLDQWNKQCTEECFSIELKSKSKITIDPNEHIDCKWLSFDEIQRGHVKFESNFEVIQRSAKL